MPVQRVDHLLLARNVSCSGHRRGTTIPVGAKSVVLCHLSIILKGRLRQHMRLNGIQ